jgi:dihydrofolate reductase
VTENQDIVLIAALAEKNRVIGAGLNLPWHIPEDLKRFKRLTLGKPLVMGRATYESIIHQFGKPLGDRRTVVLSRGGSKNLLEGVETYRSIDEVMDALSDEPIVYIGGGGTIYEQFLPRATTLELTLIDGEFDGDTFFPPFEHLIGTVFEQVFEARHPGFRFVTYGASDER